MARVFNKTTNPWGKEGGEDVQRSDLWFIDFTNAISNISKYVSEHKSDFNKNPPDISNIEPFYLISTTMPSNNIRAESVMKHNSPINRPGLDDALDPINMSFHLGVGGVSFVRNIVSVFSLWRTLVRAGRYPVGNELTVRLNTNYTVDSMFDIEVYLLSGSSTVSDQVISGQKVSNSSSNVSKSSNISQGVANGVILKSKIPNMSVSGHFTIVDAWLSKYKITDLNYSDTNKEVVVDATFYASNMIEDRG